MTNTNTIHEQAYQLTAYERFGGVGYDEYLEMLTDQLELDDSMIADYMEYLTDNGYEYIYTSIEEITEGMDPTDAARAVFFGDVKSWAADYFRFDGYGNIESLWESELFEEMKNNRDFCRWYLDRYGDTEDADDIIEECNKLIAQGY